jgi:hypothetical protein
MSHTGRDAEHANELIIITTVSTNSSWLVTCDRHEDLFSRCGGVTKPSELLFLGLKCLENIMSQASEGVVTHDKGPILHFGRP